MEQHDADEHRPILQKLLSPTESVKEFESLEPLKQAVQEGFDMITAMFMIHYFFESREKLQGFVDNIARFLKPGGVFVGTTFDAERVAEELDRNDGVAQGRVDGRLMWEVARGDSSEKIVVYVESINQKIAEWFVDFDLLQQMFLDKGIHLIEDAAWPMDSTGTFETLFDAYPRRRDFAPDHMRWSRMNRYFAFQKSL